MNEIYSLLKDILMKSVSGYWNKITLYIEINNKNTKLFGKYENEDFQEIILIKKMEYILIQKFILNLKELKGKYDRWNRAIFKIYQNETFSMKYIWDEDLNKKLESA